MAVLSRRNSHQVQLEVDQKFRLDLRRSDLSGATIEGGSFSGARFNNSRLEATHFHSCLLHGTIFSGSLMNHCDYYDSELVGTRFDRVRIDQEGPWIGFISARKTLGLTFVAANVPAIDNFHDHEFLRVTFGSKDTIVSDGLEDEKREAQELNSKLHRAIVKGGKEKIGGLQEDLEVNIFSHWSPYHSNDLSLGPRLKEFFEAMDLRGFPHP